MTTASTPVTGKLNTAPNIPCCDDVYEALIDAHSSLSPEASEKLNARLILLLLNHIGDPEIIFEAIAKAATDEAASG